MCCWHVRPLQVPIIRVHRRCDEVWIKCMHLLLVGSLGDLHGSDLSPLRHYLMLQLLTHGCVCHACPCGQLSSNILLRLDGLDLCFVLCFTRSQCWIHRLVKKLVIGPWP